MTDEEAFEQIDISIKDFELREGQNKKILVLTKPHSDWLVFKWRQLNWTENDIHYLIEVYPIFNQQEKITGWTLYAAAYYDDNKKRYYISHKVADHKTIEFIAVNASDFIKQCYEFLSKIEKSDIPYGVPLT